MRRASIFIAVVTAACSVGVSHGQSGVVDSVSPYALGQPTSAQFFMSLTMAWQQQVRMTVAGQVEGFRLRLSGERGARLQLRIKPGTAWSVRPALITVTVTKNVSGVEYQYIDLTGAGLVLGAGESFVVETLGLSGPTAGLYGSYVPPIQGPALYTEPLFYTGRRFVDGGWRHGFECYVLPTSLGCIADANADGGVDGEDVNTFFSLWSAGDSRADVNLDGGIDGMDVVHFIEAWTTSSCR